MNKYIKKSIIEANQWFKNGDHPEDDCFRPFEDTGAIPREKREGKIVRYYRDPYNDDRVCIQCSHTMHNHGWIDDLEGGHIVCPGDWIIKGVKGKYYSCKDEIFNMTYTKVNQESEVSN